MEESNTDVPSRKRRAVVKPSLKDLSDSEDEFRSKRSRKYSSDDDYCQPIKEPSKQSQARRATKTASTRPKVTKKQASSSVGKRGTKPAQSRRKVGKKSINQSNSNNDSSQEEQGNQDITGPIKNPNNQTSNEKFFDHDQPCEASDSKDVRTIKKVPDFEHSSASQIEMEWAEHEILGEQEGLDNWVALNLVKLFEGENTIPFIARYRKEMTGNMEPEQLRHAKETFEEILHVKQRAASMLKNIEKLGKLTTSVRKSILCSKSTSELELINTPFKTGSKRTLAERARQLGLENAAQAILTGSEYISLSAIVNKDKEGLGNEDQVKLGIQHIIADIISKDRGVLDFVTDIRKSANIRLESSRAKGVVAKEVAKGSSKEKSNQKLKSLTTADKQKLQMRVDEESKFRNYFEFGMNIKYIKPHQVLAINRGENKKELTVRVVVPEFVLDKLALFCRRQWLSGGIQFELRNTLFEDSIKDSYNRLICPLIVRQVRSELNQNAERASIEVFAANLKKLLLMPPFRGHVILGIDPGFYHGCKVALIGQTGDVLETGIINLNYGRRTWDLREDNDALWLRKIMVEHRCEVIALGNGTACRETEEYLSELIQTGFFKPQLHEVSYTIVSEQGASIYSCSEEAKNEFPSIDPNLISAVSIARRLQDPLAELVKVEPKHLGVGMYQHDVPDKKLTSALNEIVVECVSFVGVDLNSAPHCLLRRIAGLNSSRANMILEFRQKHGPFITREDIKKVKSIGEKSFEQCAGFIRILPKTIKHRTEAKKFNPLDQTWIHPESYTLALRFLDFCNLKLEAIGCSDSIRIISQRVADVGGLPSLAKKLNANDALMKLIVEGLQMPTNHDFRSEFEKPLFRKGLTSINELHNGDVLTGRVTNTTHFGAFIDIGVGQNGLVHNSGMGGKTPQFGDRVQVKVLNVELARKRIGLQLLAIL